MGNLCPTQQLKIKVNCIRLLKNNLYPIDVNTLNPCLDQFCSMFKPYAKLRVKLQMGLILLMLLLTCTREFIFPLIFVISLEQKMVI